MSVSECECEGVCVLSRVCLAGPHGACHASVGESRSVCALSYVPHVCPVMSVSAVACVSVEHICVCDCVCLSVGGGCICEQLCMSVECPQWG